MPSNENRIPPRPQKLSQEELVERRRKDIATLKASTQLLQEARKWADNTSKMTEEEKGDFIKDVDQAVYENSLRARSAGYTQEELDNVEYSQPSEISIKRYEEYLKRKGKTHEEIARKDIASVIKKVDESKNETTRRRRRSRVSGIIGEEIQRVENEEQIMNSTRVKREGEANVDKGVVLKPVEDEKNNETPQAEYGFYPEESSSDSKDLSSQVKSSNEKNESTMKAQKRIEKRTFEPIPTADGYVFNPNDVPENVTWDTIPLPSNGECYPTKQRSLAVAELTAADENLIASPHMYRDGKILDVLLRRKILDKSIDPDKLCKGDRDAIILWLRKSAYDSAYPVYVTNPTTGKRYEVVANLDDFNYKEFNLIGDEEGLFTYTTADDDEIKFRFLTHKDEEELKEIFLEETTNIDAYNLVKNLKSSRDAVRGLGGVKEDARSELIDCLDDMFDIMKENNISITKNDEEFSLNSITEQMNKMIVSVNGNRDESFIRNYVNYMKAGESRKFRQFVAENQPGVDFKMTINIPESDGGGSFNTFLRLEDSVFLNV